MKETIISTNFSFPSQRGVYHGKVRDVYSIGEELLVMVASDRISAFDVVLPKGIPYKGQVLNQIADKFLDATSDIVPNWKISSPDPMVTIGHYCKPFPIEMIIRGYLTGSSWRSYKNGANNICGVPIESGLKEHQRFSDPIITPTTKSTDGHDEDISKDEIINQGLITSDDYSKLEDYTRKLFDRGTKIANERGLILVDTKYEFGKIGDQIYLIDEIHTPDSSRYFYADTYQERFDKGESQKQLSKEFVREWLLSKGFQGLDGQEIPEMTDDIIDIISERYIELYEQVTGEKFRRAPTYGILNRIGQNVEDYLKNTIKI